MKFQSNKKKVNGVPIEILETNADKEDKKCINLLILLSYLLMFC